MKDGLFLIEMGAKIKARRKELKISYPKMSKLCETDMSNYWFLEQGKRNPHILTIKRIAEVLGMELKDLIS